LKEQTCKDFEWLIVDDGSTDNTEETVLSWGESCFAIRYIKQPNGGKHRAVNHGVMEAKGELFFIVDSDDILTPNSIERILHHYDAIKDDKSFGGLCGLKAYYNGEKVGDGEDFVILDCNSIDFRFKYKMKGDMSEVIRTDVMREFPFPEFEGERFCSEFILFNRIATKYKLRYFYEKIYLCEYLEDGLTAAIVKIRMKSPNASTLCYSELFHYNIPFIQKVKAAINYWRFYFCGSSLDESHFKRIGWGVMCYPLGLLYHIIDTKS
jgi:glycosyltransferase involved in cell wall biosynthesis